MQQKSLSFVSTANSKVENPISPHSRYHKKNLSAFDIITGIPNYHDEERRRKTIVSTPKTQNLNLSLTIDPPLKNISKTPISKSTNKIPYWGISENDSHYETTHAFNFKYDHKVVSDPKFLTKSISPVRNLALNLIPLNHNQDSKLNRKPSNNLKPTECQFKNKENLFSGLSESQKNEDQGRRHYEKLEFNPSGNNIMKNEYRYYRPKVKNESIDSSFVTIHKYLKKIYDLDSEDILSSKNSSGINTSIAILEHANSKDIAGIKNFKKNPNENAHSRKHFEVTCQMKEIFTQNAENLMVVINESKSQAKEYKVDLNQSAERSYEFQNFNNYRRKQIQKNKPNERPYQPENLNKSISQIMQEKVLRPLKNSLNTRANIQKNDEQLLKNSTPPKSAEKLISLNNSIDQSILSFGLKKIR